MNEQEKELIDLARSQGAQYYSPKLGMFWRPFTAGGYEAAFVSEAGELGKWYRCYTGLPLDKVRLPSIVEEFAELARQQGATHYSPRYREFYRPSLGGYEVAQVTDGNLSEWRRYQYAYLPESSGVLQ